MFNKIKRTWLWAALCVFLLSEPAIAQTISGSVQDARTRESLPGAAIIQQGSQTGTTTNADGHFELRLDPALAPVLEVSYLGYHSETVRVAPGQAEPLRIYLRSRVFVGDDVVVIGQRADASSPVTFTNYSREQIEQVNVGADLPMLLEMAPSVVATSDAGAGIGYTGIRIRGVDPTRINVTINGIPLNDSESHGVFWVNMPDFASSVEQLQIQRGVGTSTNGQAAFGASVNIQTGRLTQEPYANTAHSVGSFNSRMHNIQAGTGLLQNNWTFDARLSMIKSDGYIDRAFSDLSSYYLSAGHYGERSLFRFNVMSGREQTYQAWNGVPEPILRDDPVQLEQYISGLFLPFGPAEHMRQNLGNRRFNEFTYDNQTDNYRQDHYQAHYSYRFSDHWLGNISLHYTYGRGYFEEFRANDRLSNYGIDPVTLGGAPITRTDIIRRRWLDNHFYGMVFSADYNRDAFRLTLGGGYNEYDGDHFGEVIWARIAGESEIRHRYYDNNGFKTDGNLYAKAMYDLSDRLSVFGDVQVRRIYYRFLGYDRNLENIDQDHTLLFFNPKTGVVFRLNDFHRLYASFGVAGKEPTRREYTRSSPDSRPGKETLYNFEAGYRGESPNAFYGLNFFYMLYDDQLILTGEVNDVGQQIRTNVPDSYRLGVEAEAGFRLARQLQWSGNLTVGTSNIKRFTEFLDDYDVGGQQTNVYRNTQIAFSPQVIGASQLRFHTGRFSADLMSRFVSRQYLDNTETKSRSIDPYFVNDLRLEYNAGQFAGLGNITATLMVYNLLNTKYESNGYTFGFISGGELRRFNYYFPQAGTHAMFRVSVDL